MPWNLIFWVGVPIVLLILVGWFGVKAVNRQKPYGDEEGQEPIGLIDLDH